MFADHIKSFGGKLAGTPHAFKGYRAVYRNLPTSVGLTSHLRLILHCIFNHRL